MKDRHDRIRARLRAFAQSVADWKAAIDRISPDCTCELSPIPGFHPINNVQCHEGRRCRAMTVLTVRMHMGHLRVSTRAFSAAQIPALVTALAALMDELPTTTDWQAYAQRLATLLDTGRDPAPATVPDDRTTP